MILNVGCGGTERYPNIKNVWGDINIDIVKPIMRVKGFVLCDVYALPFPKQRFQHVIMLEVLEHLRSPMRALREIREVLQENGTLCLSTPNSLYILKIVQAVKHGYYIVDRGHIAIWGKFELYQLLRKSGFIKIRIGSSNYRGQHKSIKRIEQFVQKLCPFESLKQRQLIAIAGRN